MRIGLYSLIFNGIEMKESKRVSQKKEKQLYYAIIEDSI